MNYKFVSHTLVDAPGSAAVVFVRGCNIRCAYCYNHRLIENIPEQDDFDFNSIIEAIKSLESSFKGKKFTTVDWLVISGGEPFFDDIENVKTMLRTARDIGLKTMIYTNGTFPNELIECFNERLLNGVHIDYKCNDLDKITKRTENNSYIFASLMSAICRTWAAYEESMIEYFYLNTVWVNSIHRECFMKMYDSLFNLLGIKIKTRLPLVFNDDLRPDITAAWIITPVDLSHSIYGKLDLSELATKNEIKKFLNINEKAEESNNEEYKNLWTLAARSDGRVISGA